MLYYGPHEENTFNFQFLSPILDVGKYLDQFLQCGLKRDRIFLAGSLYSLAYEHANTRLLSEIWFFLNRHMTFRTCPDWDTVSQIPIRMLYFKCIPIRILFQEKLFFNLENISSPVCSISFIGILFLAEWVANLPYVYTVYRVNPLQTAN